VPSSLGQYFDTDSSPLNPYNQDTPSFVYGTLPIFLNKIVSEALDKPSYDDTHLVGRGLAAFFDAGTVLLIFLIGRRLYGSKAGLLAALLLATAAFPIQHAHFFVVDPFLTFFTTLTLYFCVRIAQEGGTWNYALAGLALGFATASKVTGVAITPVIGLAALIHHWPIMVRLGRQARSYVSGNDVGAQHAATLQESLAPLVRPALGLLLAVFIAFLAFRVAQPYAFDTPGWSDLKFWSLRLNARWVADQQNQNNLLSGDAAFPPSIQWIGRTAYLHPLQNMVLWGMGPALGVAAWGGFLYVLWRAAFRRETSHLLPAFWVALYFLSMGWQFSLYMRYFLPLYGPLALFAAYLLLDVWRAAREANFGWLGALWPRIRPGLSRAARALVVAVVAVTVLWGLSYANIYARPVTRVEASRWINENVPPGSAIAAEAWDDALPVGLPGGKSYNIVTLNVVEADSLQKLAAMADALDQAGYISISSNRNYDSLTRVPAVYPMMVRYYDALFNEELGFRKVATFTSYPGLFGISIPDGSAEESFTVYDHPKVILFEKTPEYSRDRLISVLTGGPTDGVTGVMPADASQNALLLRPKELERQMSGGTWTSLFNPDSLSNRLPVISWLLMLELVSLALVPLAMVIFRHLPDGGYLLTKPLALLAIAYPVWLGATVGLFDFSRGSVIGVAALLLAAGALAAYRWRGQVSDYVRRHWRAILVGEALFLAAFLAFYFLRMANPDLWHPARGGEKPMDFAYLNAVTRSAELPPYDPWFGGGYINYYYFGQFMTASLIKATGIVPEVAYNLAVPLFFALTVGATASLGYNLAEVARRRLLRRPGGGRLGAGGPVLAGLLAVAMVTVLGNLDGVDQMVDRLAAVSDWHLGSSVPLLSGLVGTAGGIKEVVFGGAELPPFDYWRSSRMMPPQISITEFPFFTFLFADLHAHLMALPYDVLALALAFALVAAPRSPSARRPQTEPSGRGLLALDGSWLLVVALALVVGSLRWINSWDYPPFLLFAIAAVFIGERARDGRLTWMTLARGAVKAAVLAVLSFVFFLPFHRHYHLFYAGLHKTTETTPLRQYLAHFGLFMFLAWSLMAFLLYRGLRNWAALRRAAHIEGGVTAVLGGAYSRLPVSGILMGVGATVLGGSLLYAFIAADRPLLAWALVALAALAVGAWSVVMNLPASPLRPLALGVAAGVGVAGTGILVMALGGLAVNSQFVLFSMILLLLAVAFLAWRELSAPRPDGPARLFVLAMLALAFGLSAGVDVVTLDGDINRMNTVFKFYLHIWVLLALAGSFAAWYLLAVLRPLPLAPVLARLRPSLPTPASRTLNLPAVWVGTLALLLIGAFLYPAAATPERVRDRFGNGGYTNNGLAFMEEAVYQDEHGSIELKYDRDAIRWLRENVEGSPITIEAATPEYRWGSRFAIYTGLPTVIGWRWHQTQQRGSFAFMVEARTQDVAKFYTTTDPQEAEAILDKYGVSMVILGQVERYYYPGPGLEKFSDMEADGLLELVYENPQTRIYRVAQKYVPPLASAPPP
jgi:YYY domain-containing protein